MDIQTTVRLLLPYYYRLWRYVLNKLDSICTVLFGYSFYHINPSDIIERIQGQLTKKRAVERKVDSHKYNDCWLGPTLILLNCWSEDRKLSAVGRKFVVEDIENLVYQRCDIQATLIRNPEICSVSIYVTINTGWFTDDSQNHHSLNIKEMEVNVPETHKQRRINVCMAFWYVSDKTIKK